MITQELLAYIKQQLALGKSKDEIRHAILAGGDWHEGEIEIAFDQVDSLNGSGVPFHKKHRLLPFLLILLALCVGGVYAWNRYSLKVQITPVVPTNEVKDTYAYTNHGFSIELPNGFVPKEVEGETGPTISMELPDKKGWLIYISNATWWEKANITDQATYLGEEKIGATVFKIYKYNDQQPKFYLFRQGNVSYLFNGDSREYMETFKFIGWSQIEGNKDDIVSFSIKPGQEVSGKIKVTGSINNFYFSEGELAISITDRAKKGYPNAFFLARATEDYYTISSAGFEGSIDFTSIPKGPAYIVVTENNQADPAEINYRPMRQIFIPVVVK